MRLLTRGDDGEFCLVEFHGDDIPRYAILSHTWGADNEEVTFKDLIEGTGKGKTGYRKIRFCGEQAASDDLHYFWIDTCCIDKSSSAELSESINSMFRWYREASKCYVYLSDVSTSHLDTSFRNSRWFTRGWTLQELVAPSCVIFYTSQGELLGDKDSLVQQIADITGISYDALQGRPLSQFSVEERISWAVRRETKRPEDWAYSLLGLFDIHMPLLYGEGRNRAFIRLQKEIKESLTAEEPMFSLVPRAATAPAKLYTESSPLNALQAVTHVTQEPHVQERVLDSLRFPQHQERRHQIHEAQMETYRWILRPAHESTQHWDSFSSWLSSSTDPRRIYWISGKPGAGKSTVMRYLDQNINIPSHLLPWSEHKPVLSAQYFFWNPGDKLQKSLTGLLRTLLFQLLEQRPELISQVVHQRVWNATRGSRNQQVHWTNSDLHHALNNFISSVRHSAKVFLLVDGLDEVDGSDEAREEMISLLLNMASFENVKICLSSRPWNVFLDAFRDFPQLKLEDLTRGDISKYVKAQLYGNARFQYLYRIDPGNAENLISGIIDKAAGVFLWVRLVVRELLRGLRDGDGIPGLQNRLDGIPSDLNHYFGRLLDSIDIDNRPKASALLQIALYKETRFQTVHPLRLLDLSFIDEARPDFALTGKYSFKNLDPSDPENFHFYLDSGFRRVNSCCMGLLECHEAGWKITEDGRVIGSSDPNNLEEPLRRLQEGTSPSQTLVRPIDLDSLPGSDAVESFSFTIEFLHRSCHDFLLTPDIQRLLLQYTDGPYDASLFLLSSRLAQFVAFGSARKGVRNVIALASYIVSFLSVSSCKDTSMCETVGSIMQPVLEGIMQHYTFPHDFWYIDPSISAWHHEGSSFLTLAIDFDLVAYVKTHLTSKYVRTKHGRPILDYILRPRFALAPRMSLGNREPNLDILGLVLDFGANPNELYGPISIWAHFLCFLADLSRFTELFPLLTYPKALEMLILNGAAPLLPKSWLSHVPDYSHFFSYEDFDIEPEWGPKEYFASRWGRIAPTAEGGGSGTSEPLYAVSDLCKSLVGFGAGA